MDKQVVLDSFALIAFFRGEKIGSKVEKLLFEAQNGKRLLFLSFINLVEVYYKTIREQGREKGEVVLATVKKMPIQLVSASDNLVLKAAEIKARYPIALGDCFVVALARDKKASILTGDPEFKKVEELVKINWL